MPPDSAEEKADEMILLQATLAALYGYVEKPVGVEDAMTFLESKGVDRTEAEEVGKVNFKGLQEGTTGQHLAPVRSTRGMSYHTCPRARMPAH